MKNCYWTAEDEARGTGNFLLPRPHAAVNRNNTSQIIVGTKHWVNGCVEHTTRHNRVVHRMKSDWVFTHGKNWKEKILKKLSETP